MRLIFLLLCLYTTSCNAKPVTLGSISPNYVYQLGTGDRLRITTYGEDKLTGEFAVSGEGSISFPLIGDIPAAGKSVAQFRSELTGLLGSKFIRDPKVTVEVINFRPVYILGEVARPGDFPFVEHLTVLSLVAKSGGFSYRANQKTVFIRHEGETNETAYSLTSSLPVRPGDTVRIGMRYF